MSLFGRLERWDALCLFFSHLGSTDPLLRNVSKKTIVSVGIAAGRGTEAAIREILIAVAIVLLV